MGGPGGGVRREGLVGRGQGRCERRIEVFVKIQKKIGGGGGGPGESGGTVGSGGVRVDVNKIEVFVKIQKKNGWLSRGGGSRGRVRGGRVDVIEELKFLGKFTKKYWGVSWGVGLVGGVGLSGGGQGGCERRNEVFEKFKKKNFFFFFLGGGGSRGPCVGLGGSGWM